LWQECVVEEAAPLMVARKTERNTETRREKGLKIPFKGTPPNNLKPPTRPHLLKVPPPPSSTTGWGPSL
jgi:hypothetical protein